LLCKTSQEEMVQFLGLISKFYLWILIINYNWIGAIQSFQKEINIV